MNNAPTGPAPAGRAAVEAPAGEFAAWNEEMVRRYDIDRYYEQSHPLIRWLERRRLEALVRLAAPRPGDRLLEVGCGGGHVLERFAGTERTGLDLSPLMLARTARRLGPAARLVRGSAETLPFETASFDIVLCTEVLEHVPDPARVVRELVRVVRPGGRVVVSIPNEANIDRSKRMLRRIPLLRRALATLAAENNEWHLHRMDYAFLHRITEGAARIERVRALPFPLLPLRYAALLRSREV